MINLNANDKLKKLGAKWIGKEWVAPELAKPEADEIKRTFYEDMIGVEVTVAEENDLEWRDWGFKVTRLVAGYIVATASGRDSGVTVSDGVAVISGSFSSGGSQKNYHCLHSDNLVLRLRVSRNALPELDKEVVAGRYVYTLLEQEEKLEDLIAKRDALQKQLDEINIKIFDLAHQG